MTSEHQKPTNPFDFSQLYETIRWGRTYAQNRSLPVLVYLIAYGGFFLLLFGLARGGGIAAKAGYPVLGTVAMVIFFVVYLLMMYLVMSKRGRRWVEAQLQRPYAREGSVRIDSNRKLKFARLGYVVGMVFGACVVGEVLLGLFGYLPISLMQPVSALYCVPFMVFLWWWQRPASTWVMLLWPALYAVHALVLISGLPIPTDGSWAMLHSVGAICGYGILAAGLSHLYSRYALRRLQRVSHIAADEEIPQP
ncbi:MAG: hypothetical protein KJ060_23225 [Candidatus Hydrogenedentes bacterium]|nr:hypothetical protein [Candidatus Hydrogenedentota bacterium]